MFKAQHTAFNKHRSIAKIPILRVILNFHQVVQVQIVRNQPLATHLGGDKK